MESRNSVPPDPVLGTFQTFKAIPAYNTIEYQISYNFKRVWHVMRKYEMGSPQKSKLEKERERKKGQERKKMELRRL